MKFEEMEIVLVEKSFEGDGFAKSRPRNGKDNFEQRLSVSSEE